MGWRFQRRLRVRKGLGLNLAKTGGSLSVRGKRGALGTKGLSVRSGITGLSYRQRWGTTGSGTTFLLILATLAVLISLPFQFLGWVIKKQKEKKDERRI